MAGSCHSGAVRIAVPSPPTEVTECHCSICRRNAALWAYYPPALVMLSGPTGTYSWAPKDVTYHRCKVCGCLMMWQAFNKRYPHCGVNARMLDGFDLGAVSHIVEEDASV